jgi:hypothetical protein
MQRYHFLPQDQVLIFNQCHSISHPAGQTLFALTSGYINACRARIPNDASIGQVMIAEQSCWRDENERQPIQAVPGARRTSGPYSRQ